MSDGAGAVLVVSEKILKQFNLKPLARFAGYSVAVCRRRSWASARSRPFRRCPKQAGITQNDVDWFELNEAFAAQSLAVMRHLDLDPARMGPSAAIALGHRSVRPVRSAPRRWCTACSARSSATAW